jgi:hypothetical protein
MFVNLMTFIRFADECLFGLKTIDLDRDLGTLSIEKFYQTRSNIMANAATEYAVYLLLSGGHREEVRFPTMQDFQKWYSNELMPKSSSTDFTTVPLKNTQGEYMLVRPSCIEGIRIEPVFASSVDRSY